MLEAFLWQMNHDLYIRLCELYSQTGRMAQAAADPLAVEFTWIDVLTLASERKQI